MLVKNIILDTYTTISLDNFRESANGEGIAMNSVSETDCIYQSIKVIITNH